MRQFLLLGLIIFCCAIGYPQSVWADSLPYTYKTPSRDGIGKIYQGREIAQMMGHMGAGWLERPSRIAEEAPQTVINALGIQPTDTIADIGAGTGYFTFRMQPLVPQGKILAVDIQPEMIEILEDFQQKYNTTNVETILGQPDNPNLPPNSVDLALLVDAYHEFDAPYQMMRAIVTALKPNGRVVLVEYRGENPLIPIKRLHKMSQKQVKAEMAIVGLEWLETKEDLPSQHMLFFRKSA
jgi:precorrin-6B methylase 2